MRANSKRVVGCIGAVLVSLLAAGCRSDTKEHAPEAAAGVAAVGLDTCYNCHADGRLGKFPSMIGNEAVANVGWLHSAHGNYESFPSDLGVDNEGFPAYIDFSDSTCQTCHDATEDGRTFSALYALYGIDAIGRVDRPVVGCESCHGNGGNHYGLGPIPYPKPGPDRCGQCHTGAFPAGHPVTDPEGEQIYENYRASPHAGSIQASNYVTGSTTLVTARCARCHTDDGVKLYKTLAPGTDDYSALTAFFAGKAALTSPKPIECRTCHDVHAQGKALLAAATTSPTIQSAQFNTCTTCHQLFQADGTTLLDKSYHTPYDKNLATVNAFGSVEETIADTHYDDSTTGNIEGYVVDPAGTHSDQAGNTNQGACLDCHNPHQADNTINRQWARSAHGGFILDIKDQAANVYTAAVTTAEAPAWTTYDFKLSNRRACQRCHTATGFRNLANNPTTYNASANTFIAAGSQKEMMYCWACHVNNKGGLRNPGRFVPPGYGVGTANVTNGSAVVTGNGTDWTSGNTPVGSQFQVTGDASTYIVQSVNSTTQITLTLNYAGTTAATVDYQITPYIFPAGRSITGISGSFVCVSCHSGRETGEYVKSYPGSIATNFGAFNSHYLAAGGVLFRTIGYEYATAPTYDNPTGFAHDTIGVSVSGTGTNGPCVGCHMENAQSHLYLPTQRDSGTDLITGITSSAVCAVCHGSSMTPAVLNTLEAQYEAALEALQGTLNTQGICWDSGYPYFKVYSGGCTVTSFTAWGNKDRLGAAFNMNMLKHMPMAFVHNSLYTRRLIFDSIDFLDNGALDGNVSATVAGLAPAYLSAQEAADALLFLNNGTRP